ncbi:MAG: S8 family peptidase [Paracoccaceae bacterium]|nr:S8 family peptidase [Paracoccaceae bacterium]
MARKTGRSSALAEGFEPKRLIIECAAGAKLAQQGMSLAADDAPSNLVKAIKEAGGTIDPEFAPVLIPAVTLQDPMAAGFDNSTRFDVSAETDACTMILVADGDAEVADELAKHPEVRQVYADLPIEPCLICPGSPPLGDFNDVKRLLCTSRLHGRGMHGNGVLLAIVDTGISRTHLASKGLTPAMDAARSWVPGPGMTPFNAPVGHGTMCAYDALLAAPRATLLDIQLLRSTAGGGFSGFLSDAVRAFVHLRGVMNAPRRPGETRSLVVNNSWGMFHPSWDFPPGDPRNYSDNPNHPFNRAVAALESAGADILFAAGNCGSNCPDGRCQGVTTNTIYGANGHPSVLTVAGVDTTKQRVGYSSQGPGRLSRNKPDISGYTHFAGSGVYAADGGTSAACPVVAGVVAAARTRRPFVPGNPAASPHAMRDLVRSTAQDLGAAGFDFDTGWGVVNGCAIADRIAPRPVIIDICRRYPWLCYPRPFPLPFSPFPPIPPIPPIPPRPPFGADAETEPGLDHMAEIEEDDGELTAILTTAWQRGYEAAMQGGAGHGPKAPQADKDCGCGCGS